MGGASQPGGSLGTIMETWGEKKKKKKEKKEKEKKKEKKKKTRESER